MQEKYYKSPDQILTELGVHIPEDIDIEAIAFHCGATIVYEPLEGCEAQIIGYEDRAIISINSNASTGRKRFSAGHELGHWMRDRGKVSFACGEDQLTHEWMEYNPERLANQYASDLLLPQSMVRVRAQGQPCTFEAVRGLATTFRTSLTATAIRLVEYGPFPSMLVCIAGKRRKWFYPGPNLPKALWPVYEPGKNTVAYDILSGSVRESAADVLASAWFEPRNPGSYRVHENAVRIGTDLVLSLLWWKDERMLTELGDKEERQAARRSDRRLDDDVDDDPDESLDPTEFTIYRRKWPRR